MVFKVTIFNYGGGGKPARIVMNLLIFMRIRCGNEGAGESVRLLVRRGRGCDGVEKGRDCEAMRRAGQNEVRARRQSLSMFVAYRRV